MKQRSLISLYGPKPGRLGCLLTDLGQRTAATFGPDFEPYDVEQIHATIVGLERAAPDFDVAKLAAVLRDALAEPITARIAGFEDRDYAFTSRGLRPHERTLQVAGDKVVLIGFPGDGRLDALRRRAEVAGARHAYHVAPTDFDDDLYMRVGLWHGQRTPDCSALRAWLASREPITVEVSFDALQLARYDDATLPRASTEVTPLSQLLPGS